MNQGFIKSAPFRIGVCRAYSWRRFGFGGGSADPAKYSNARGDCHFTIKLFKCLRREGRLHQRFVNGGTRLEQHFREHLNEVIRNMNDIV